MARNRYIEGEQLFEQAERVFGASQGIDAALKLSRFWLRRWREGAFGDHQDLEELLGWFQHAGDLAGAARCKLLLGDACRQHLLLTESLHYYQTHEDHFYAAWALHFLAREATDIAQAVELQQRSLALRRQIKDFNGVIYALYNLSTDSLQQGLLQESTQAAQKMLDLSLHMNEHSGQLMAYISLSLNMLLRAQPEQAAELNNQAQMLAVKINHPLGLRYSLLLQALCALQQEQLPLASDLLHQLAALAVPDLIRYFEQLATAMLALSQGEHEQARQPLTQALRYALTVRGSGVLVWCLALGAFWAERAGFLHLAEQSSVAQWITRWPPLTQVAANLPIAHLSDTTVEDSARQLLTLLSPDDSAGLFASSVLTANESLIEPLSIRELEVLTFIAKGLSNQDIADRLTVEISTIKKHITNIYGKLGVSSRTQAMLTARELGLVDFR